MMCAFVLVSDSDSDSILHTRACVYLYYLWLFACVVCHILPEWRKDIVFGIV